MRNCNKFKCEKDTFAECENKERFDCIGNSGFHRCGCECCEYFEVIGDTECCIANSCKEEDEYLMELLREQQEQM